MTLKRSATNSTLSHQGGEAITLSLNNFPQQAKEATEQSEKSHGQFLRVALPRMCQHPGQLRVPRNSSAMAAALKWMILYISALNLRCK